MMIRMRPDAWYWKCGASHHAVPARGFTDSDQRQPGSRTSLPTTPPPIFTSSSRPLSKMRTSSGAPRSFLSYRAILLPPFTFAHARVVGLEWRLGRAEAPDIQAFSHFRDGLKS